jgi:hypothetical protein
MTGDDTEAAHRLSPRVLRAISLLLAALFLLFVVTVVLPAWQPGRLL